MSKTKYISLLIIGFIFLNTLVYFFTEQNQNKRIELSLKSHVKKLQTHYDILMHQQKLTADSAYKSTIIKPNVIDIIAEASNTKDTIKKDILRKKLYKSLLPRYKRLIIKGVLQYHFVFPNNEVFLRFHKPSKYGDNLTNIRSDFKYTNETLKRTRGFTQGRTSHAFRNVYPLFDKENKHIGAMEISFSSEDLQENFTLISKMHTHFLVNKTIFQTKTWERDDLILKYIQSAEHDNYMMAMTKQHIKEQCIDNNKLRLKSVDKDIKKNINIGKPFGLYIKEIDNIVSLAFLPIYGNNKNKILAWIVAYEDNNIIKTSLRNTFYIRITLFSILLILFYFIYIVLNQKVTLEKLVDKKTTQLKEINENLEQRIIVEVKKSKDIEKRLFESEKLASMGEMIGNIAHQWRQPLSVISTSATGMQVQKMSGVLDDNGFFKTCDLINNNAQYLSKTIDDFRNFIKGDREKSIFNLADDIDSFLHLVESSVKNHQINVILDLDDEIKVNGYQNELSQCFINIFNNSKDVLKDLDSDRYIFISTKIVNDKIIIEFKDNAGGIPEDILPKIFEPYFTTKHQSQGTGLGLHMTYNIIVEGMGGTIEAKNSKYKYNNLEFTGALFTITLIKIN